MYCVRKVLEDLWWVGGNDRRLAMFEGVYAVPNGVSYNSYLLLDDKTVLFDTVDPSVSKVFFENVDHVLAGRKLDYLVIHHMEPDHSGTVSEVLLRHPETVIVCSPASGTWNSSIPIRSWSSSTSAASLGSCRSSLELEG